MDAPQTYAAGSSMQGPPTHRIWPPTPSWRLSAAALLPRVTWDGSNTHTMGVAWAWHILGPWETPCGAFSSPSRGGGGSPALALFAHHWAGSQHSSASWTVRPEWQFPGHFPRAIASTLNGFQPSKTAQLGTQTTAPQGGVGAPIRPAWTADTVGTNARPARMGPLGGGQTSPR